MSDTVQRDTPRLLTAGDLAQWRAIPAAVLSDERAHQGVLSGVQPLFDGRPFAAQAFTIHVAPDAIGTPRDALAQAWPGAAMVIDARATPDAAVWGGNLIRLAKARGIAAVVVYGKVRDRVELRDSGLAVCSLGVTPRGPMWKGHLGRSIRCGGVDIASGDLIVGDDDGVIVVPLAAADETLLARCRARLAREAQEGDA